MVYVLLPYMVLTLFATMKAIDPSLMRAARGLGAGGSYAFRRVYLPLSMHGVISGSLIVFILAIGFFITPALMGGPEDVMIAMLIERSVEITVRLAECGGDVGAAAGRHARAVRDLLPRDRRAPHDGGLHAGRRRRARP